MIKTLLFDFANVLLFAKRTNPPSSLSRMYAKLSKQDSIWNNYMINAEIMNFLEGKKDQYCLAILTASYNLPNHPEIKPILTDVFQEVFYAHNCSFNKDQPACYIKVLQKLETTSKQTVFIDDKISNIAAAKNANLQTIHYQTNEQLFAELKELGVT